MKNSLILITAAVLSLAACEKAEDKLFLYCDEELYIGHYGGPATIRFYSNNDWEISSSEPWLTVSPSSGKAKEGAIEVVLNYPEQDQFEPKTATLTITSKGNSKNVFLTQPAKHVFEYSPKVFNLSSDAQNIELTISSNYEYNFFSSECEDWVKAVETKGAPTTETKVFSVSANDSHEERVGHFYIKDLYYITQDIDVITIRQAGKQ